MIALYRSQSLDDIAEDIEMGRVEGKGEELLQLQL